jgi:ribonuclease BN (tRNA processing enzyme)
VIGLLAVIMFPVDASAQNCEPASVAVQILGSGGPRINPFRSSTGYLLWVGDQSRVLVDLGGGALGRFGQTQAKISDLSLLAVSHLHPDQISDLPAFLWQSHLERKQPLPIVGPSGNDATPDFSRFLSRLFDENDGAFPVLGATLGGKRRADRCQVEVAFVWMSPSSMQRRANHRRLLTATGLPQPRWVSRMVICRR